MEIYLVGGAVRDQLLGLPVKERDWVVVGSDVEHMLALGYQPVGKDFPVFLHPETHEEYALARTERKIGRGYHGFTFYAEPDVTLEMDLKRRDLTINAIAQGEDGELIDPFSGQQDIKNNVLRHVSSAFQEDPVRILRLARFAARFASFHVHPDTLALAKTMVEAGEVDALVAERVWKECAKALTEVAPARFFRVLQEIGAFARLFPGWDLTPGDLEAAHAALSQGKADQAWAFLLAKQPWEWVDAVCRRYRVPHAYKQLCRLVVNHHHDYPHLGSAQAKAWLEWIKFTDALRRPQQADAVFNVCAWLYPHADHEAYRAIWHNCLQALHAMDMPRVIAQCAQEQEQPLTGEAIKQCVYHAQLAAVHAVISK